jgi:hypothetical protein
VSVAVLLDNFISASTEIEEHERRMELEKKFKVTANQLNRVANAERATAASDKRAGKLSRLGIVVTTVDPAGGGGAERAPP